MTTVTAYHSKSKITVTLSRDLVSRLDALLSSPGAVSRSRLVEEALHQWLREHAQRELERQTEKYYLSISKAERKEDQEWSKIAATSARHLWDK